MKAVGYDTHASHSELIPFSFERREPRSEGVAIDISSLKAEK